MNDERPKVRLDKWLWAARFFKTRSLAVTAIEAGRVEVHGNRVKRSKQIEVGDPVQIRLGPYEHRIVVKALSERRGPASVAAGLFDELPESKAAREALQFKLKSAAPSFSHDAGKPTKKQRRDIEKLKRSAES